MSTFHAMCMKEKKNVKIKNHKFVVNKNCGVAVRGECPDCGTTVQKFIAAKDAPADIQAKVAECKRNRVSAGPKKSAGKAGKKSKGNKSGGKAAKKSKGKASKGKK